MTETKIGQLPDQQPQRNNYQEEKFPDGMIKQRSWETPEGKKITEGVAKRGYWKLDLETNKGDFIREDLITEAFRIEQDPDSQEKYVQLVKFTSVTPTGVFDNTRYQSDNPYVELQSHTADKNNRLITGNGRSYRRALYPKGEVTSFGDEKGRRFSRNIYFEETPEGWKKTTITNEVEPERPGSHVLRNKSIDKQEELIQKDQLPILPDPNNANGFTSLDAMPEEYFKIPTR